MFELQLVESKLDTIELGYGLGEIRRFEADWQCARLADRGDDDSALIITQLASPLQMALIENCLLFDNDGQPDICVHGSITPQELRWWLEPIVHKWNHGPVYVNGETWDFD